MVDINDSPASMGLPPKFVGWREHQKDVVSRVVNSDKKYFVCEMPTGAGKSLIGLAVSHALGGKSYYVVHTKQLQDQILEDFPDVRTVKGRSNFKCLVKPDLTADFCVYAMMKKKCPVRASCPYYVQKAIAMAAATSVHNYSYFLTAFNFVGDWETGDLLILDECHLVDGSLLRFVGLTLTYENFDEIIRKPFPGSELPERIMQAVHDADEVLTKKVMDFKQEIFFDVEGGNFDNIDASKLQEVQRYERLLKKVRFLLKNYDDTWIIDYIRTQGWKGSKIVFRPIWVDNFSDMMFKHGDKVLMMSATVGNIDLFCKSLGLDRSEVDYMAVPSNFPRENRPFVFVPIGRMSNKYYEGNEELLVTFIDGVVKKHREEKGVIHTVNYQIMKDILESTAYFDDMIYHHDASDREVALKEFKKAEAPKVLVSPSMHTGIDLPDDEARWQILCKLPFASLGDKQIKKRLDMSPDWYRQDCAQRIVQTAGRIVRSKSDKGVTYCPDTNFRWFVQNHNSMFPGWFLDSVAMIKRG